ncbi:L,D-transpeptidase family protein [Bradyrhizobium sp. 157]|nr:L,D-transpeptidase family protein [Bradyrhizobium sp. 157]
MRVSGHRAFSASIAGATISKRRFWQIAMLTAAGTVAAASQADAAAMFYWQDSDPGYYYRPIPTVQPRRPKVRRPSVKTEAAIKETNAKPQGPLIIAVSIEQQKVSVYDANGLFAESPVSTGMKGHSTPMGVFSIIQKHKMHRSNIYSGAPMPYMQRITWSGIALHAGVLPGYPASHGCIRMPTTFAIKMWNWTRMGARVIITPGQITPASFSHPLLVTQKVVPPPLIADDPASDAPAVKGDKGADAGHAEPSLELRSTVGHAAPLREQTHTADAGSALPTSAVATMSDATPSAAKVQPFSDTSSAEAKADAPKSEPAISASGEPTTAAIANVEPAKVEAPKLEQTKAADMPAEPVKAVADTPAASVVAPEVKKDNARLPGAEKAARAEPPRRPGQIAVFVSRKDSKLYVRENFKPQFDLPVTIAPSDRPLGTHVFTVAADKNDPNLLRWSVVSLPVAARNAARIDSTDRAAPRGRMVGAAPSEVKPLPAASSPAEALDRIAVAPEVIARIAEMLTTGSSIVVSDHGINTGGETGEGTDFIVPLRMVQP